MRKHVCDFHLGKTQNRLLRYARVSILNIENIIEPRHEKTNVLHIQKHRRKSASL